MNNITTQNPLMQPVQFNGRAYFTSQYFHAQYKTNLGEKYNKLEDFNRLIRSMETFNLYTEKENIVKLSWTRVKESGTQELRPLFESSSYNPIMLIDATAQVALSHHLDDEISKSISVAVNTQAAVQAKADIRYINQQTKAALSLVKLLGLEGNQAILSADKAVRKVTGYSPLELTETALIADVKEKLLNPTEIGSQINLSNRAVNQLLEERGYQTSYRDCHNALQWQPTEKGKPFGEMLDTGKSHGDGTPIKQWKWYASIIQRLNSLEVVA